MAKSVRNAKEESFNFRVSADLKAAFQAAADAADRPAAQVLRDFMRAYVEEREPKDPDYDWWFRTQVRAAIDDPRPSVPHDTVMARTRAVIDRIAREKDSRAD